MIQSLYVYGFMLISMIFLGVNASNRFRYKKKLPFWEYNTIGLIFIFVIISGLRYDVGVDHLSYVFYYQDLVKSASFRNYAEVEIGFFWIFKLFTIINAHYTWVFGFFAFVQILLIFKAFENQRYLYPYLAFVIITSGIFFTMMNEIRQATVWAILIYAVKYANIKGLSKYAILVFIGFLIHRSALLLIPIFFIIYTDKDFFKFIWLQLLLIIVVILVDELTLWNYLLNEIVLGVKVLNYTDKYADIAARFDIWQHDYRHGFRYYAQIIIYFVTIIYSKKLKVHFSINNFTKYYNLFFIGSLMYFVTYSNTLMQRPARYFTSIQIVITSYLLLYLWYNRRNNNYNLFIFFGVILIHLGILFVFINSDYHTMYLFYWQK